MLPRLGPRRRSDPKRTLSKLHDIVDPHCGIITGVERFDVRDRSLRGVHGYAMTLEAATTLGYGRFRDRRGEEDEIWRTGLEGRQGTRVAFDPTRAFVRAIGEALERYACCTYEPSTFTSATWREIQRDALDPRACQLPNADEREAFQGLGAFDPDAPMRWRWGSRLPDGRPILVPAQMCYVMYNPLPGEARLTAPSSTGWAIHHTREEAIHSALREVIERDSFILTWLHRLPVPTLDIESVMDPQVQRYLMGLQEGGARVRVLVTTTDLGIPAFAVAASDPRPGRPAFLLTAAAHPDPLRGLRQAVEEAAMMRLDLTARLRAGNVPHIERMEDATDIEQHAEYYLDPAHLAAVEWLLAPTDTIRLADISGFGSDDVWAETKGMIERLARAGHETLYVDGTPPDLAEAGWHAAKIIVPGTVRHEYGHGLRYLDCPRIYEAPVRMGHRARPARVDELNTDLHPYA